MLRLVNGSKYNGTLFGSSGNCSGELVFQTGMVGYIEAITDPSYAGQILVFTYPMIGNYGIDESMMESKRVWVAGVVIRDLHDEQFDNFLKRWNVPGIYGVDTRALVSELREEGTILAQFGELGGIGCVGCVGCVGYELFDPSTVNLVKEVSCDSVVEMGEGKTVLVVDCGMKRSQVSSLLKCGVRVKIVPWNYDYVEAEEKFDGLFLSNGPGDPRMAEETVLVLQKQMAKEEGVVPIFGICLGHQLMAVAAGLEIKKLKYGNRAQNIPVRLLNSERAYITTQNHGYAVEVGGESESEGEVGSFWKPLFTNLNDGTNEGMFHKVKPFFSVQFHPEARAGPWDTEWLFEVFTDYVKGVRSGPMGMAFNDRIVGAENCNKRDDLKFKKVLLLGSGGLTIGQAGEFDYSGSQALKAYKECGLFTVLINPNIATVQTTTGMELADKIYSLPITVEYVEQVIKEELPDCIAVSFGGQTALNCACALVRSGVLKKYGVQVLGTEIETIELSEDRGAFKEVVAEVEYECAPSDTVRSVDEGLMVAEKLGYPVLVRSGFALGGLGSGFADDREELKGLLRNGFVEGGEMIIDKSLKGWKELEYEIVRDAYGNCITVCNMENFDPVGVHTGESIVVAPSQTINDHQYFMLRKCSIDVANKLGIVGECNIQFALHPKSNQFYVIELNARLSRSSALASKATGYPLAYIAAKLSLGYSLLELRNCVTEDTVAMYEPSLDYCVVKFPRWDLNKFDISSQKGDDKIIGTVMKSVGEVMAIGATFEEALMKAIRMVGLELPITGGDDWVSSGFNTYDHLSTPTTDRVVKIFEALVNLTMIRFISNKTNITKWFLGRFNRVAKVLLELREVGVEKMNKKLLEQSKKVGFSDQQISAAIGSTETEVRKLRDEWNIHPVVKKIDTVAAEFPCRTNYLYLTYGGSVSEGEESNGSNNKWVLVLGSGVYRIGSSVEFDWCSVNCIKSCQEQGRKVIMLNYNPETVSTDYDIVEKLYFDEIELETVLELWRIENMVSSEKLEGVIVSVGGQQPNNIAKELETCGVRILGTEADMIDSAENRYKFSRLLDQNGVDQPVWRELTDLESAFTFCQEVEYPCLIRPSYVLSGAAMNVAFSDEDLKKYLNEAASVSKDYPVVISKFIIDAKEIEVDAVAKGGEVVIMAVSEHIENAGVHSGDATLVFPAQDLTKRTMRLIEQSTYKIAAALEINGPFNIQFIAKDDQIKVIECNLRSSRSFPFVSKVMGVNFIKIATEVMLGVSSRSRDVSGGERIGVKVPQFSFHRLAGADCVLGVEMMSTGEVACFGKSREEAYLKGLLSVGYKLPVEGDTILISVGSYRYKKEMLESVKRLSDKYQLVGTTGSADFYKEHGVLIEAVSWSRVEELIRSGVVKFVINVSMLDRLKLPHDEKSRGYAMRRAAIDNRVGLLTDVKSARLFIDSLFKWRGVVVNGTVVVKSSVDCMNSHRIVKLPGLIDPHVHIREPGDVWKGDWDSETAAALAGGVTTVFVMPNTKPPIVDLESLNLIRECAKRGARCRYGIILGATMDNHDKLEEIMEKSPEGVVGLKMYLDQTYTGSDLQFTDWGMVEKHFANWRWKQPIIVHTEYDNLLKVVGLMTIYRRRVHVAHAHSKQVMEVIKRAKEMGLPITCEVAPHHLLLNKHSCHRGVKPPLSEGEERLEDYMEWIDCFATDHAPHLEHETGCPGYPGLETALALMLRYGVDVVKEKMYDAVVKIFGVDEGGGGRKGDWIEVDLDQKWVVPEKLSFSRSGWTPYNGMELTGLVRRVFVNKKLAYIDDRIVKEAGTGEMVSVCYPEVGEVVVTEKEKEEEEKAIIDMEISKVVKRGSFKHKMILSSGQFSRDDLRYLFQRASEIRKLYKRGETVSALAGKLVGVLFYEPSTRTHGSFVAGVRRLGGEIVEVQENSSSIKKGETLEDTIKCLESYVDCIVLRGRDGYCQRAANVAKVPIINAGDGVGEHPTQALLDIYTIREERGTVNGLTVTMIGDLKNGRTTHSLAKLLCLYNVRLRYVSVEELRMPDEVKRYVEERGIEQSEHFDLSEVIEKTDVLYVTRIQEERFTEVGEYEKMKENYVITPQSLSKAKRNLVVMHPLPRKGEISVEVDTDPRAVYFRQMEYGLYLRMALLSLLFDKEG